MKLNISFRRDTLDSLRRYMSPSHWVPFVLSMGAIFLVYLWSLMQPSPFLRLLQAVLLIAALLFAWFGMHRKIHRRGLPYLLAAVLFISTFQNGWNVPGLDFSYLAFLVIIAAAVLYGMKDGVILVCVLTVLEIVGRGSATDPDTAFLTTLAFKSLILLLSVILCAELTGGHRRKVAALREELELARSSPYVSTDRKGTETTVSVDADAAQPEADIDSLEKSIEGILHRIKASFRAHSVVLLQPYGDKGLVLRHAASDSSRIQKGQIQNSLFGQMSARGVSCRWNLDDPGSTVTNRDLPYYISWEPVRHMAACPLKGEGPPSGVLVVDRVSQAPFTDLDMLHLEIFAIQLLEMIQMGKRYIEQVDRNLEYRIFYQAMSELGQSLATEDVLEGLARACQRVVASTYVIVGLADEAGLAYEIAIAHGSESLKGSAVRGEARTWISWLLRSSAEPILLRDIRSHSTAMPIASPSEGDLDARSVLMVPLTFKGKKLAILFLGSTTVDYYRNWHLRIIASICQQGAAGIENSLLHRRVENEAVTDGLTQLENHRYFQERLKSECSRARRSGGPLSLIIIDIDHFKKVNDTYGHRVGDIMLQRIAGILKDAVRSEDSIARYGGEEFVVILTASDRKGALKMAERLRKAVERTKFVADEYSLRLTITSGTATFSQDGAEPWELIEHADQALYAGKARGRNCVVQYHSLSKNQLQIRNIR